MSQQEIQGRQTKNYTEIPELTVPPFHLSVKVNTDDAPRLDAKELDKVLPKITMETLLELLNQAHVALKKKQQMNLNPQGIFFFADMEKKSSCEENQSKLMLSKL
jgi:hypothetical protein